MLIHQTLILNVSSIELTPNNIVDAPPTSKLTKRGNFIGFDQNMSHFKQSPPKTKKQGQPHGPSLLDTVDEQSHQ